MVHNILYFFIFLYYLTVSDKSKNYYENFVILLYGYNVPRTFGKLYLVPDAVTNI